MADISVMCHACGRVSTVSEYVDPSELKCACGASLTPTKVTAPKAPPTVVSRRQQTTDPGTQDEEDAEGGKKKRRRRKKRKSFVIKFARFQLSEHVLSWLIFIIMGGLLGYLRFGKVFEEEQTREDFIYYGLWAWGLTYLVVIVDAFKDEFFEGLLSIFVPPYTLFYIFYKSDSFALRAILGALSVGFGVDVAVLMWQWGGDTIHHIQTFLDPDTSGW